MHPTMVLYSDCIGTKLLSLLILELALMGVSSNSYNVSLTIEGEDYLLIN
jgi:hypothetical protein